MRSRKSILKAMRRGMGKLMEFHISKCEVCGGEVKAPEGTVVRFHQECRKNRVTGRRKLQHAR